MANFLKKLKIPNSQAGKLLTTDENGVLVSTNKEVTDVASATDLNNLDERVSELENDMTTVEQQLEEING